MHVCKKVPDIDSGVVCCITVQNSSGPFDDTLVGWRHRNDCTGCNQRKEEEERAEMSLLLSLNHMTQYTYT